MGFGRIISSIRDGLLLNSSVRTSGQGKLSFLVNYIDYDAGIPSSINATDFRDDPRRAAANWLAARGFEDNQYTLGGVSYAHEFNSSWESTLSIFYTYLDHYEPRPFNILDEYTQGFGFRSFNPRETGTWGTSFWGRIIQRRIQLADLRQSIP